MNKTTRLILTFLAAAFLSWGLTACGDTSHRPKISLARLVSHANPPKMLSHGKILSPGRALTVTFNQALSQSSSLSFRPTLSGSVVVDGSTIKFIVPSTVVPDATYQIVIHAVGSGDAAATKTFSLNSQRESTFLLQKDLAQLNYLPVTYHGNTNSFSWRFPHEPLGLKQAWKVGLQTAATSGAIMSFENENNLEVDGKAGPMVWKKILADLAAHRKDPLPYDYLMAVKGTPEVLKVWRNGRIIFTTPMNSGVAGADTENGTFPVYLRYPVTQMVGTDVDGAQYDVTVYWVAYFNGGDAVHAYPRDSYGYPQSNGCVEIPTTVGEKVWTMDPYGTLVTVEGNE